MNMEQTSVELREAQPEEPLDPPQAAADADATEADVSEADLDQEEQEKQPMTAGGDRAQDPPSAARETELTVEKNGAVKLKVPEEEEEEVKFTGLNKEELLRVAGTPGWVRTRRALLLLFWLGWLGMLLGAVAIILRAPRCRDLPVSSWWSEGPLYQIGSVPAFSDAQNLKGLEHKLEHLAQLKVRAVAVGPIHVAPPDEPMNLRFEEVSPEAGSLEQFKGVIQAAHRKGISVVLDLTPNYQGSDGPWFSNISVTNVAERLKSALVFWLNEGVDGVQMSGVERVSGVVPLLWSDIRAIVQNGTDRRLLVGVTERSSAKDVSSLLSSSGVDLLISRVLPPGPAEAMERAWAVQLLYASHSQTNLAWGLGGRAEGHLASLVGPALVKLYQLLLLTLPGTPVFNYGDEIGLTDERTTFPRMLWDSAEKLNGTLQEERSERLSRLRFFRSLSELRGKERSLLFGDFILLSNSSSSLAYLRAWDQSQRYLAAFNWAEEEQVLELSGAVLPRLATVALSTNSSALPADSSVDLGGLRLGPGQAVLLTFPYGA